MADEITLQITVQGAGKATDIAALVDTAMAMRTPEPTQTVIPAGYRCAECYEGDGGHTPDCSFKQIHRP
jgi:hypothetical protein